MPTKNTPTAQLLIWLSTNLILLCFASLWPSSATGATVTASKHCDVTCTVVEASFTITTTQTIQWSALYNGSATQGHSFYLSTVASNLADIPLTTNGAGSGSKLLSAGTYHISIRLALMGPGFYTVEYNSGTGGDPHLTASDGNRFDFQSAGEFVFLRNPSGLEIQVRQGPNPTTGNPGPDRQTGLATCVSINTAVAARVGTHRVTYEPNLNGLPDPSGLQLRVDGVLTTLDSRRGIDLQDGGRITKTAAPGGLRIEFPDKTVLFVIPGFWTSQQVWFLNLDVGPPPNSVGLAGPFPTRSWLPALPDGTSLGPMPDSLHDRFVTLYQKFGNAWRVTAANSLFDYAPGTSTDTFTVNWPPEDPPCSLPSVPPANPTTEAVARDACRLVRGESPNQNCIFDVMFTGNTGFADTYLAVQDLQPKHVNTLPASKYAVSLDFGAGVPHGTFSNFFDPGFSFNATLEYVISPYVSAEGKFGYHRFPGDSGGHLNVYQFSGNGKFYLIPEPNKVRPFVNGGIGAYKFDSGATKFGGNVGAGILFEVTPRFGLQGSYNFHTVNTPFANTTFSTVQGGVRFRF